VDVTEKKIVASAIWLLVLQSIFLRCSLFRGFLFDVRSANYGRFVTFKGLTVALHFSVSNWNDLARGRERAGTCECGNEPSGSIKCGEFLDKLRSG